MSTENDQHTAEKVIASSDTNTKSRPTRSALVVVVSHSGTVVTVIRPGLVRRIARGPRRREGYADAVIRGVVEVFASTGKEGPNASSVTRLVTLLLLPDVECTMV